MSLNPRIGHLYHDENISNPCTVLDAKEKMRTREINAREAKTLDKYAGVLDKAKRVCRRQNDWEQTVIRRHLTSIKSRTPSLAISLRNESERLKVRDLTTGKTYTAYPVRSGTNCSQSAKESRRTVKTSPWSVYTHVQQGGDPASRRVSEKCRTAPVSRYRSSRYRDNCDVAKTENLVRRAGQVTRSLHTLYTKSFQRKWKEKDLTVLDILNRNSKEELEKALFVLRGTPTGEAIEDILRDREMVSKAPSEGVTSTKDIGENEDLEKISEEVFLTKLGEAVVRPTDTTKPRSSSGVSYEGNGTSTPRSGAPRLNPTSFNGSPPDKETLILPLIDKRESDASSIPRWSDTESPLSLNDVFERDNAFTLSSTMANPSEADVEPTTSHRWTDIFKAPELWKQRLLVPKVKVMAKRVSVVTITGKIRQTMLK